MKDTPAFIDSHCHLDFPCFDSDRQNILAQCSRLGVSNIIVPGTQFSGWNNQINLAKSYSQIKVALGLHPYFLKHYKTEHLDYLQTLLFEQKNKIVALGEIGLDAVVDIDWDIQLEVFSQQLELAKTFSLPIILHHRKTHNELIQQLKSQRFTKGGIVHAFSGSLHQAETYIDMGFKLGVGGGITYPRANKTRLTLSQVPLSSLVLETDAPDMPLNGRQGKRNSPEYLPEVFDCLVELRAESAPLIRQKLYQNTKYALTNMN
ncbi:TatD family hydrolase [Paraglaciecola sp.]|uniref:TatD family hydrolase n=1 Tax=Paraglaciecola sp. TaxID=1920173 RepID=UPI003EF9013C